MSRGTIYNHMIYETDQIGFMTFDTIVKHHDRERESQAQREAHAI